MSGKRQQVYKQKQKNVFTGDEMLELKHKKLKVWKLAMEFVIKIYELTEKFPTKEMYNLISQIRRSAVSIPSNIAEGSARSSSNERRRFYEISRSSLAELDTQLEIALDLTYCRQEDLDKISKQMNHLFASLSKLIKSTI